MGRVCLLVIVLVGGAGCTAEDKAQWDEAWKDLRGDNMQMRTGNWGAGDRHSDLKSDD